MKATRIFAHGLKGQNFDELIGPATIWIGPMGVGKTSRLLCLKLALEGVTGKELGEIASGVTVGAEFDHPGIRIIERRLVPHELGLTPSPKGKKGVEALQKYIDQVFSPSDGKMSWDLRELVAMSDSGRIKFLEALSGSGGELTFEILNKCTTNDKQVALLTRLLAESTAKDNVKEFLSEIQTTLKEEFTGANKALREAMGTRARLVEMRTEKQIPHGTISAKRKEIAEIDSQIIETEKKVSAEAERVKAVANRKALIDTKTKRVKELETELLKLEKLAATEPPELIEPKNAPAVIEAKKKVAAVDEELRLVRQRAEDAEYRGRTAFAEAKKLRCNIATITQSKECPVCHAAGDKLEGVVEQLKKEADVLAEESVDATNEGESFRVTVDGLCIEANAATTERDFLHHEAFATYQDNEGLIRDIKEAKENAPKKRAEVETIMADLTSIMKQDQGAPLIGEEALKEQCDALKASKEVIKKELQALEAQKARQQDYMDNEQAIVGARESLETIKALQKALGPKGLLGEVMGSGLEPLEGPANDLIQKLAPNLTFKFTLGSGKCDFGCIKDGMWISYPALSDGERAIVAMGLIIAFTSKKPYRYLLVNGFNEIYEDDRETMMKAIVEQMEQGNIDNFLATCNVKELPEVDGIEVKKLEKPKKEDSF